MTEFPDATTRSLFPPHAGANAISQSLEPSTLEHGRQ
jgi:hypothetical protein